MSLHDLSDQRSTLVMCLEKHQSENAGVLEQIMLGWHMGEERL